jgi:hypothetical protein
VYRAEKEGCSLDGAASVRNEAMNKHKQMAHQKSQQTSNLLVTEERYWALWDTPLRTLQHALVLA